VLPFGDPEMFLFMIQKQWMYNTVSPNDDMAKNIFFLFPPCLISFSAVIGVDFKCREK